MLIPATKIGLRFEITLTFFSAQALFAERLTIFY